MTLTKEQITAIAESVGLTYPEVMSFISVESGGIGFSQKTGRIIIQFEPTWFHRYLTQFGVPHTFTSTVSADGKKAYTLWDQKGHTLTNGVEDQTGEWNSFNVAFQIHPDAAMLSTSIGLMQIMGFHYKELGYATVGAMWDDFKRGEHRQVYGAVMFIKSEPALFAALKAQNWEKVAYYYNGSNYQINHYNLKLAAAYAKYSG